MAGDREVVRESGPGVLREGVAQHQDGPPDSEFAQLHAFGNPSDGKPLDWFVVAGADGQFYPGLAEIDGDHIRVTSPRVPEPRVVRFGWDEGARPNLMNGAGLPASPFRTDAEHWSPPAAKP